MGLHELHTAHPATPGAAPPQQLASCVDTHLRADPPGAGLAAALADPARAAEWQTVEVPWNHATRVEARDFSRWVQITDKPRGPGSRPRAWCN